ncbi:MAG: DUF2304 domain-containing protein [Candidatus Magasanikbacteria bacterium]|nr:DUF2304 domain-containing protein [Candidatus Magasanikbacteria bacterium]
MLNVFQIFFVSFAVFVISAVIKRRSEGLLSLRALIFWILFWFLAIVVVFWPNSTEFVAEYFGIGRGADLVVYVSLAFMFYILLRLHIKIESMNRDLTKIVRKESLEKK